ncbi:MAG TPA: DUF1801 domain-containing protein [Flavobacterium sp.]|jgi:hypothetical protein
MQLVSATVTEYIAALPSDRQEAITAIRSALADNLPAGFEEIFSSNMINYVVPHSIYPPGYHCNPKQALPFISLANQKNFVALYHMGLYADPETLDWFVAEYKNHSQRKLDMGKSCIRFKHLNDIPLNLIAELAQNMSVGKYLQVYERNYKK